MDYCFLKGFLVVLLIQHCTCEDLSTSVQSSTAVTLQDDQASPHEPELTPAEVVPVVAPPSLREVQQAVQEASEQVEGRGAEEVLKGLLERVVEAALGQAEGGGEVKADEAAEQETIEEVGAERGETESEVMEQAVEEEAEGEDIGAKEVGDTGVEVEREVANAHAFQDVAEEEKGPVGGEAEIAAGSVEGTAAGVETGGREAEEVEVVDEPPDAKVSHEVVEEAVVASDETGGYLAVEEAGVEGELSEEQGEIESQEVEEAPAVVGGELEQETVVESDPSLAVADVEQIDLGAKTEALEEESQLDDAEGEAIEPPADSDEMETTQSVVGEPVEDREEGNVEEDGEGTEAEDEQGHLAVEGGAAEGVEAEGADAGEAEGESVIKDESVAPVDEGVDGEEAQSALETSHGSAKEDQEAPVISAPEPEDGADSPEEQSPENQGPTTGPSRGGAEAEAEVNTLGDEKSNDANDIITAADDLLPHDPVMAQPTLDNLVEDVAAEGPQAEGEEPGEANELVEDIAVATETSELSLEAWKIGAISAAVFLVLETVVIIIYILKCRDKNSSRALQRACEEGCVEPEAATGGDCSDDTLPAGNGDAQQIAALDPSDVASTLAQNKEQHEEEHAIAMSDLPPSSTEESANTGPGPDSSQDPRTSIL